MPDITMCNGDRCEAKQTCYRFTATPDEQRQTFFRKSPVTAEGTCDYWMEIWKSVEQRNAERGKDEKETKE